MNSTARDDPQTSGATTATNHNAVSQIVFDITLEDPQAKYLSTLGNGKTTGTTSIDLTLYEIKPNVFEGQGILTR